jgi:hypothetical protein
MFRWTKAASVGYVWLTAVMTLVAGVPQVECICARDTAKFNLTGKVRNAAPCCCGGACCSCFHGRGCCRVRAGDSRRPIRVSSAVSHYGTTSKNTHGAIQRPQCMTRLSEPDALSSTVVKTNVPMLTMLGPLAGLAIVQAPGFIPSTSTDRLLAPPPDLLTLHQHFII